MSLTAIHTSLALVLAILSGVKGTCPNGTEPLTSDRLPPGICLPGADGCPAGTAPTPTYVLPWYIVTECRLCPSGYTTFTNHTRFCRRLGYPCPDGYYETDSGDCWRCVADEYFDLNLQRCVSCPTGSGAAPGFSLSCAPCSSIIERNVRDSSCFQYRVFLPRDNTCPPGSHVVYRDSSDVPVCRKCRAGFFSDHNNSTQCASCPSGTVAEHDGAEVCSPCSTILPGSVPNRESTACIGHDGCSLDTEPAVVSGRSFCRSPSCGNGNDSHESVIGRVCGPCSTAPWSSGFLVQDGDDAGECELCPLDSLSDGLVCTTCPRGQVRTEDGRCGCRGQLALTRGVDANGNCVRCPAGSYGVPGPDGENVCTMCPAGSHYFSQTDGQLLACFLEVRCKPFLDLCNTCQPNMFSAEEGSLTCEPCPEGTFSYGTGERRCLREEEISAMVSFNDPFGNPIQLQRTAGTLERVPLEN